MFWRLLEPPPISYHVGLTNGLCAAGCVRGCIVRDLGTQGNVHREPHHIITLTYKSEAILAAAKFTIKWKYVKSKRRKFSYYQQLYKWKVIWISMNGKKMNISFNRLFSFLLIHTKRKFIFCTFKTLKQAEKLKSRKMKESC